MVDAVVAKLERCVEAARCLAMISFQRASWGERSRMPLASKGLSQGLRIRPMLCIVVQDTANSQGKQPRMHLQACGGTQCSGWLSFVGHPWILNFPGRACKSTLERSSCLHPWGTVSVELPSAYRLCTQYGVASSQPLSRRHRDAGCEVGVSLPWLPLCTRDCLHGWPQPVFQDVCPGDEGCCWYSVQDSTRNITYRIQPRLGRPPSWELLEEPGISATT